MGWGFLNSIGDFFKSIPNKVVEGVNTVGSALRTGARRVGNAINTVTGGVRKGFHYASDLPFIGDVIKGSPIGSVMNTGLGIAQGIGNVASALGGEGSLSDASRSLISSFGGSPEDLKSRANASASELIKHIMG
jgi:hypothetical protein